MPRGLTVGILAHVDAGKTTMAEALLYTSGSIRTLGRVDHRDAHLDTARIERERGITVFSKQAVFPCGDFLIDLLDTPGHADFSAEAERTLSVLDCAILVVSAPDGVQAHTRTIWELLSRYHIPVFVWINKMDLARTGREEILADLAQLGGGFVDFSDSAAEGAARGAFLENVAMQDEEALERFLSQGGLEDEAVRGLIRRRKVFPCYFGSALRLEGVDAFLSGFARFAAAPERSPDFGARVYKITRTDRGERLSWLKITGGQLRVRDAVNGEKVTRIRRYSSDRYDAVDAVEAGSVCAVEGLSGSFAGQALGKASEGPKARLVPVMTYRIVLPEGVSPQLGMEKLSQLAEEDPMLDIEWDGALSEIRVRLMGQIQIEVLRQLIRDRFDWEVSIDAGRILYRETIASPVLGAGHFEPLRHYAEVHLLVEPLPTGSGIVFASLCSTDDLDLNWQRLILGSLETADLRGVLTGAPLTDVRISLAAGRAHAKHTEGGDFRQAACRALRQALMKAENVLLEPVYAFTLEVPSEQIGRAIGDLRAMSAVFSSPEDLGDRMRLTGRAPAGEMQTYQNELAAYTKGRGRLSCRFDGYAPCHDSERVACASGYDAERDTLHPADSVFCSHGAGLNVRWDAADAFMHVDSGLRIADGEVVSASSPKVRSGNVDFDEHQLSEVMSRILHADTKPRIASETRDFGAAKKKKEQTIRREYWIVDGYNVIYAWEELASLAKESLALAREKLAEILAEFRALQGCELLLVFDGYKVRDNPGSAQELRGLHIVYTKENQSADMYIEQTVHEIGGSYAVRVVTSDGLIQLSAIRLGVLRMSSRELQTEVEQTETDLQAILRSRAPGRLRLSDVARIKK